MTLDKPLRTEAGARSPRANLAAMNPRVKPGDDFFLFVNGRWHDAHVIPKDEGASSRLGELQARADAQIHQLVQEAAASNPPQGTLMRKAADVYASGMAGAPLEAINEDLQRIQGARSHGEVASLFGRIGLRSPFRVDIEPAYNDPNVNTVFIGVEGPHLPHDDYYLRMRADPHAMNICMQYHAYIAKMLGFTGIDEALARSKAGAIMDFETQLAKARALPDEHAGDHLTVSVSDLMPLMANFDFPAFLQARGLQTCVELTLHYPRMVSRTAQVVAQTNVETLQTYLMFHRLDHCAELLSEPLRKAKLDFEGAALMGREQPVERWKDAVWLVNRILGEPLGQVYAERHCPLESRQAAAQVADSVIQAYTGRIEKGRMSPQAKQMALQKLDDLRHKVKIGGPGKTEGESGLEVRPDDPIGNLQRADEWKWESKLRERGRPAQATGKWMLPQNVGAWYRPQCNDIQLTAAILQEPVFDPKADAAALYGGFGAVVGHEIAHAFYFEGARFAPDGRFTRWWAGQDEQRFDQIAERLMAQFSALEAVPGLKSDGQKTLSENVCDLAGLSAAYDAYRESLRGSEPPVIDGLSGDQRFFIAWAKTWRVKYRDAAARTMVYSDPHSPGSVRANGAVQHHPAWKAAFDVRMGDKLHLPDSEMVTDL